ncbi:hypothetical protein BW13_05485 [Bifidobacterium sp. UTCIF-37]|uniref:hypothetical protein n=1 Tax=unclassified Bifidobacterium TaxID=2608897 RepID=UPI0015E424BA|nr:MULTISPECIES: hypothetical protein [unclassified Bifidobacterium]TPF86552.1 hypothetical protein BW13_05485 [Bifidobacterium sp. UTCIF-37]TPF89502.1 hypothetical protein BW11_05495 [Bifidobacterium sp. UTCIF-38]
MTNPKNTGHRSGRPTNGKGDENANGAAVPTNIPSGFPNPDDKPHLDSGLDSNNVRFNDNSLLNPQRDDDWDIPALSFPNIDEHGGAPSPEEMKQNLTFPSVPSAGVPADAPTEAMPPAVAPATVVTPPVTPTADTTATVADIPPMPPTRSTGSHAARTTGSTAAIPTDAPGGLQGAPAVSVAPASVAATPASALPSSTNPAPVFPPDSGSETTVLPPLNINVPVPGHAGATDKPSPVIAPGAVNLGKVAGGENQTLQNLEDVSDEPTEAEEADELYGAEADRNDSARSAAGDSGLSGSGISGGSDGNGRGRGGNGDGDARHGDHSGNDGTRAVDRKPIIIGVVVAALVAAAVGGVFAFQRHQSQTALDTALSNCEAAASDVSKANDSLAEALKKADEASKLTVDQVSDATTISKLKTAVSDASGAGKAVACDASLSTAELTSRTEENSKLASTLNSHIKTVDSALKAVTDSQDDKNDADVKTAKDNLQKAVTDAQTLMTNSEGAVADDSTRQTLQSAIDAANKLIGDSDPKLEDLQNALKALQDATNAVNDSMSSYSSSRRSSSDSNSGTSNSNGTNGTNGSYTGNRYNNRYNGSTGSTTRPNTSGSGSGSGSGSNGSGSGSTGTGSGSNGSGSTGTGSGSGSGGNGGETGGTGNGGSESGGETGGNGGETGGSGSGGNGTAE